MKITEAVTIDIDLSKLVEDIPLEAEFTVDIDESHDDEGRVIIREKWWTHRSRRTDVVMSIIRARIGDEVQRLIDDGQELVEAARKQDEERG